MIRTLDLFSGIGGFSYGLRSVCKTVAYCEVDAACVKCLRDKMDKGLLERAPIYGDVSEIPVAELRRLKPKMITGGFPCQDISSLNTSGAGVDGPKSRLVFEMTRLAKALPSVKCVMMENSPFIKHRGLQKVLRAFDDMGWTAKWSYFKATEVGAVHVRKRWVMLACAPGYTPPKDTLVLTPRYPEPPRLILRDDATKLRGGMLGNSVVPAMMAHAYNVLRSLEHADDGSTECGSMRHGAIESFKRKSNDKNVDLNLNISQGSTLFVRKLWTTPIKAGTGWSISDKLIATSLQKFPNQVVYEKGSKKLMKALKPNYTSVKDFSVNPIWVEWLMMYPRDWTK